MQGFSANEAIALLGLLGMIAVLIGPAALKRSKSLQEVEFSGLMHDAVSNWLNNNYWQWYEKHEIVVADVQIIKESMGVTEYFVKYAVYERDVPEESQFSTVIIEHDHSSLDVTQHTVKVLSNVGPSCLDYCKLTSRNA